MTDIIEVLNFYTLLISIGVNGSSTFLPVSLPPRLWLLRGGDGFGLLERGNTLFQSMVLANLSDPEKRNEESMQYLA